MTTHTDDKISRAAETAVDKAHVAADQAGRKVFQQFWNSQSFTAGQTRTFTAAWTTGGLAAGSYSVKVGVFAVDWRSMIHWNDRAADVALVTSAPPTTTRPPTATTTTIAATTTTTRLWLFLLLSVNTHSQNPQRPTFFTGFC